MNIHQVATKNVHTLAVFSKQEQQKAAKKSRKLGQMHDSGI